MPCFMHTGVRSHTVGLHPKRPRSYKGPNKTYRILVPTQWYNIGTYKQGELEKLQPEKCRLVWIHTSLAPAKVTGKMAQILSE